MNNKPLRIGVMAPSSHVPKEDIEKSKALLESKGHSVFIHPQTFEKHRQSAGKLIQKSMALQGLWQRDDIDIIWAAGGGNRSLHLLDMINYDAMKDKPKTLVGFSDVTGLLNTITAKTGHVTYHAPVFKQIHSHKNTDDILHLLSGEPPNYDFSKTKAFQYGKATGKLIGGNLSVFQYLPKTFLTDEYFEGAILFLEDCNEELSRIDRMLCHLRHCGVFDRISGLIMGNFTDLKDTGTPFEFTFEEIVSEHIENFEIPIVMKAPFGHAGDLVPFPIGAEAELITSESGVEFKLKSFLA